MIKASPTGVAVTAAGGAVAAGLSIFVLRRIRPRIARSLAASPLSTAAPDALLADAPPAAKRVRVNHLSLYASDTAQVASDLAFLVDGEAHQLGPLKSCGGWVTFLNPPESLNLLDPAVKDFVEIYPRSKTLIRGEDGRASFGEYDARSEKGAAVHLNLNVPFTREKIEERARSRGLRCAWRGYLPLVDVWLEEDPALLIELAPPLETLTGSVGNWR